MSGFGGVFVSRVLGSEFSSEGPGGLGLGCKVAGIRSLESWQLC